MSLKWCILSGINLAIDGANVQYVPLKMILALKHAANKSLSSLILHGYVCGLSQHNITLVL